MQYHKKENNINPTKKEVTMSNNKTQRDNNAPLLKQSSVEWLIDNYFGGIENCSPMFRRKIAEAKAMHKEEIEEALLFGETLSLNTIETYYKVKFGGNK